jgi:hypothetical protein
VGPFVGSGVKLYLVGVELGCRQLRFGDVVLLEVGSQIIVLSKSDGGDSSSELLGLVAIIEIIGCIDCSVAHDAEGVYDLALSHNVQNGSNEDQSKYGV